MAAYQRTTTLNGNGIFVRKWPDNVTVTLDGEPVITGENDGAQ